MIFRNAAGRFWEIDFLRGIALVIMIGFHFLLDLNHVQIAQLDLYDGPFLLLAYSTASVFVLLAGLSTWLRYHRLQRDHSQRSISKLFIKRGLFIFSLGMFITLITLWYIPEAFVVFGILHCIGLSFILIPFFLQKRHLTLLVVCIFVLIGLYLRMFRFDFYYLIPLGFIPKTFSTIDYFPLFPWFGVFLLGHYLGHIFYPHGKRRSTLSDYTTYPFIRQVCFFGRNSLYVYFLHQPIIVGLIHLYLFYFSSV